MKTTYGLTKAGKETGLYTITNTKGASITICDLGGIITNLWIPDRDGKLRDIVLAYDNASDYEDGNAFMGSIIGRVANRISNSKFTLNGQEFKLAQNDGPNSIHGGNKGFDKYIWHVCEIEKGLKLSIDSPDMDENYPGNMHVEVTYTFDDENCLTISYLATSDQDTLCNLTNHTYFNLDGHDAGHVGNHLMKIYASKYTLADGSSIPTGEIAEVAGTPFDFSEAKLVGRDIGEDCQQLKFAGGYDHNYILDKEDKELTLVSETSSAISGIMMTCETTQPAVQFYSGNHMTDNTVGKGGVLYQKQSGLCLETQGYPDAINHDNFPSVVLKAGDTYQEITKYKFTVCK